MKVDSITFSFYVPMYGSGAFSFDKVITEDDSHTLCTFMGVPEGTCDIISDSLKISIMKFDEIYEFITQELMNLDETSGSDECSISLHSGDELVKKYSEDVIDYDKFIEILYSVINTYADEMSQYLW